MSFQYEEKHGEIDRKDEEEVLEKRDGVRKHICGRWRDETLAFEQKRTLYRKERLARGRSCLNHEKVRSGCLVAHFDAFLGEITIHANAMQGLEALVVAIARLGRDALLGMNVPSYTSPSYCPCSVKISHITQGKLIISCRHFGYICSSR